MVISPPLEQAPQEYVLESSAVHRRLLEDEALKPYAFAVGVKPGPLAHKGHQVSRWVLQLAASSQATALCSFMAL